VLLSWHRPVLFCVRDASDPLSLPKVEIALCPVNHCVVEHHSCPLYWGFAVLQLQKHWHRTAEFVFSLATLFALGCLVVQVWNNPDGFRGGIAFTLGVFAIAGNIWFVHRVEADIQEDKSRLEVAYITKDVTIIGKWTATS